MLFRDISTDEMRSIVRHHIETLERWLRRLIDDVLQAHYDGTLTRLPMRKEVLNKAIERQQKEPGRYPREVDALLFDDLIAIICHSDQYSHFREALGEAFKNGEHEARTYLNRIVEARNPLAHSNDITSHQALRVVCYTTDVIESLKVYYKKINMAQAYNAPSFIRVWDDRGNSLDVAQLSINGGPRRSSFKNTVLRPGDVLKLEVQPDESFPESSYSIIWVVNNVSPVKYVEGRTFSVEIEDKHVNANGFTLTAKITSKASWHRYGQVDDSVTLDYSILPPI